MASARPKFRKPLKVGDRVRIKKYRTWIAWGDRKPQQFGFITAIEGAYIYVRPRWRKQDEVIEFYDVELALANHR